VNKNGPPARGGNNSVYTGQGWWGGRGAKVQNKTNENGGERGNGAVVGIQWEAQTGRAKNGRGERWLSQLGTWNDWKRLVWKSWKEFWNQKKKRPQWSNEWMEMRKVAGGGVANKTAKEIDH